MTSVILPDVNVLIYAFRSDVPQHAICRPWLIGVLRQYEPFGLSPVVLSAVVRITTNPRAFRIPSPIDEAFGFCDDLLNQPHCEIVEPGENHWEIFRQLCIETSTRGPKISDAWFAALAIEWDCDWVSCDSDFARFPGLRWRSPEDSRQSRRR